MNLTKKGASLFQVMAKAAQRHKSVSIGNVRDIIWSRHLSCMRLAGMELELVDTGLPAGLQSNSNAWLTAVVF